MGGNPAEAMTTFGRSSITTCARWQAHTRVIRALRVWAEKTVDESKNPAGLGPRVQGHVGEEQHLPLRLGRSWKNGVKERPSPRWRANGADGGECPGVAFRWFDQWMFIMEPEWNETCCGS